MRPGTTKTADVEIHPEDDGGYLMLCHAMRDGARRSTFASDLTYRYTTEQYVTDIAKRAELLRLRNPKAYSKLVNRLVLRRAGE